MFAVREPQIAYQRLRRTILRGLLRTVYTNRPRNGKQYQWMIRLVFVVEFVMHSMTYPR